MTNLSSAFAVRLAPMILRVMTLRVATLRVFPAMLLACLLFAQQGSLRHAMGHVLVLHAQAVTGASLQGADVARGEDGACELCAAFAVVTGGAVGEGRLPVATGGETAAPTLAGALPDLPPVRVFAPRGPPCAGLG